MKKDKKEHARKRLALNFTRRSYLALTAAFGGLLSTTGVEAASSVIEDFERYDGTTTLDDVYSSNIGAFDVVTDTVFEGAQSLYSVKSNGAFINSTSGLDTYPSIGDTVEWYTWSRAGSGDRLHFLPQSETNRDNHYSIDHSLRDDRMRIGIYVNGNSEYFAVDTNFTTTRDERWLRHRLETEDTGSAHAFTYKIYEYNSSGEDTLLNSISGTDTEASISGGREFSTGGIGWLVYGNSGAERWFDGLAKVDDGGGTTLSVTTGDATNVGETSATLNGTLNDLGGATSADVYFEWGPSGNLSNATTQQTLSATGTFSEELTGLETGTDYEFRAVAQASDGDTDTGGIAAFTTGSSGATSDFVSPYYNLASDPTSQSLIYWIDERTGADGGEQTFAYGTDSSDLSQQETVTGTAVPEKNGIYRYVVDLSGLSDGTTYYGDIRDGGTTLESVEWRTLPATLPDGGLDIALYSDIHIDNGDGMGDPSDMIPVREEDPDLVLFGGDYITWGDGSTSNRSDEEVVDWWLDLFREWYGTLNESRLHPVLPIPGNHEVGNHSWDGTGTVNPEQGVFQFFYGNPRFLDPVGENYGQVTVGDYLQLLALDTHSAYPEDVGAWLGGAIDGSVLCTIPFHHSPLLSGGNRRVPEDDDLQRRLRDEWLRTLWEDDSVLCHFAGHIHLREYTVPYTVVDTEPSSGDYIPLDSGVDGYLVEDTSGAERVMQFGTGYRANRSYDKEWFTDYIAEQNQFYSLTLTSSQLEVRELDTAGNPYESHIFSTLDLPSVDTTAAGDASFAGSGGDYTISAAGADVWESADEYGALYKDDVSGDVVARTTIESQENTHPWAKSGIMIANDLTTAGSSAGDVIVAVTPENGFAFQWDGNGDGFVNSNTNVDSTNYPCDLRLTKSGSGYIGEYSTDGGSTWTTIDSVSISDANSSQDVGLVTTSHNTGTNCTAEFANFTTEAPTSVDLPSVDTTATGDAFFSGESGDYTISAAGADVWESADEYGALYKDDVSGDVVARTTIESQENTHPWAKSGIMIANDITTAGSSAGDVIVAISPENGFAFQWDSNGDGFVNRSTDTDSTNYPCDLRLTKSGSGYLGEYSTDGGSTWTTIDSVSITDANSSQDVGLFTTSHNTGTNCTADFANFTTEAPPSVDLASVDTTAAGDASFVGSGGDYTISAAGADVWESADEYGALYKDDVSGDVVARTTIESQENTHPWAKSGIMIANDITTAGSSAGDVIVAISPENGFAFQWDSNGDGFVNSNTNVDSTNYPCDLRLTKSGSEYIGEYSTDGGSTWTTIDSVSITDANSSQDVGLFTTSHNTGTNCTAEFANFTTN
ncbi:metallophosphoesterase [Haloarcula sp. 1CSR25-25]|uniref:metallophosphoesterase n=1 Tax=Haloarcula sp. 1CSR25-25 TaxID=2862545 RepID=UPI002893B08C|nr:metallophosphoesterase [Haloarcula sp. 1CSR25-25]MDT3435570.1 metallophosphoesterase [Haloarcula sp. 1CSR25-25]